MKGDFTRDSFAASRRHTRVLLQQGRLLLDADWNEQVAILLHRMETMIRDLVGPHGGPEGDCGFEIRPEGADGPLQNDFGIGTGRYYVGGLLCENDDPTLTFSGQGFAPSRDALRPGRPYLVYLDAWEDYVSPAEDPALLEVALGGADTAGRARVFWRVQAWEMDEATTKLLRSPTNPSGFTNDKLDSAWPRLCERFQPPDRGRLRVRVTEPAATEDLPPSIVPPGSGYRGPENHLYRVEVHAGGRAAEGASFKWSRDNGSLLVPVLALAGNVATLGPGGPDARIGLGIGDIVEVVEPQAAAFGKPGALFRITDLPAEGQVTLQGKAALPPAAGLLLRRWDQRQGPEGRRGLVLQDGAAKLVEGEGDSNWLPLEDGILVQFAKSDCSYRSGDHWLIPARTAEGGSVAWPCDAEGRPAACPPHGIHHRYAPLGIVTFNAGGVAVDCASRIAFRMSLDRPSLSRA